MSLLKIRGYYPRKQSTDWQKVKSMPPKIYGMRSGVTEEEFVASVIEFPAGFSTQATKKTKQKPEDLGTYRFRKSAQKTRYGKLQNRGTLTISKV